MAECQYINKSYLANKFCNTEKRNTHTYIYNPYLTTTNYLLYFSLFENEDFSLERDKMQLTLAECVKSNKY